MAVGTLEREIGELRNSDPDHLMVVQHTLGRIVQGLLALSGLFGESMERDPGWRFMDAGRRLERGQQLVALLRATVTVERSTATDSLLLESVLVGDREHHHLPPPVPVAGPARDAPRPPFDGPRQPPLARLTNSSSWPPTYA